MAACIAEFRAHGFAGARIDRIAERACVSKRTLYKHFPSKDAMFDAIAADTMVPLPRDSTAPFDPARPIADQLIAVLTRYMSVIVTDEYITVSRIIVAEFIADPIRMAGAATHSDATIGPVEDMIARAMNGELLRRADPAYAAAQLTGMLKTFFFWPRFLTGSAPLDHDAGQKIIADCVAMFLSHYHSST